MHDEKVADLIPDGHMPLEIAFAVKCLDPEGNVRLYIGSSEALTPWEKVGMLAVALDDARDEALMPVVVDDGDDD